jgi:lipid-A-disaccharide synthase
MTTYFLFAGEASGDLHGSRLIQALRKADPAASFCGTGGPSMRKEKFDCLEEMESFQVMGFSDVLKAFPRLWKLFHQIRDQIIQRKPDCLILIDYPGFNLRLAKALRKKGFKGKIVQYICPSVWAHGRKRIDTMAQNYDLLLTIYPFEAPYFSNTRLKVEYIGNPLVETIQSYTPQANWKEKIGMDGDRKIISLFPGSRKGEIKLHLPLQLQTAAKLKSGHPKYLFALSCAQESLKEDLLELCRQTSLKLNEDLFIVPSHFRYELMRDSTIALAKSGTVSLELALHAIPSVIHYELTPLNYIIAKYLLRLNLPHYCIVNILAGKTLFPEWMGRNISPENLAHQMNKWLIDPQARQTVISECRAVHQLLQNGSSAAEAIKRIL